MGFRRVIKAWMTGSTRIALTGRGRVIQAALEDVFGLKGRAHDAVRPAQLADGLLTLTMSNQMLDTDLPCRSGIKLALLRQ
jgi:hypothetical protein